MSLRCLRASLCEDESVGVFEHKVHLFSNTEAPAYVHYGWRPAGIMGFSPPPPSTRIDTQPVHVALCWAPEQGCQGSGEQSAFSPSWSRGFLDVLRVSTICTEEEEEEEEHVHHRPQTQMMHTGVTGGGSPKVED